MKFILTFDSYISFDHSCNNIHPIEYSSAEALLYDFENELLKAFENKQYSFLFGTEDFFVHDFINEKHTRDKKSILEKTLPVILTINEWFEKENIYP